MGFYFPGVSRGYLEDYVYSREKLRSRKAMTSMMRDIRMEYPYGTDFLDVPDEELEGEVSFLTESVGNSLNRMMRDMTLWIPLYSILMAVAYVFLIVSMVKDAVMAGEFGYVQFLVFASLALSSSLVDLVAYLKCRRNMGLIEREPMLLGSFLDDLDSLESELGLDLPESDIGFDLDSEMSLDDILSELSEAIDGLDDFDSDFPEDTALSK